MAVDERFAPTAGRVSGIVGLLIAAAILGTALFSGDSGIPPWGIAAALLTAAVSWTALLKPGLAIAGRQLVMRNMFATISIPLRLIDSVAVRQVTAVTVGDKRFVSAAVGRSRVQMKRDNPPPGRPQRGGQSRLGGLGFGIFSLSAQAPRSDEITRGAKSMSYGFYVEEKIQRAAAETKLLADDPAEPDAVHVQVAWLEVLMVTGTLVATVVLLFA